MKSIPLRDDGTIKTLAVLGNIVDNVPGGQTIAQLRARERLAKAFERSDAASLELEDSDHAELVNIINSTGWVPPPGTRTALLQIIDDVLTAKEPELPARVKPPRAA